MADTDLLARARFWEAVLTQRGTVVFVHPDDVERVSTWVSQAGMVDVALTVQAMPEPVLIAPGQVFVADGIGEELGMGVLGTPVFDFDRPLALRSDR